jgi:hypothetical protein
MRDWHPNANRQLNASRHLRPYMTDGPCRKKRKERIENKKLRDSRGLHTLDENEEHSEIATYRRVRRLSRRLGRAEYSRHELHSGVRLLIGFCGSRGDSCIRGVYGAVCGGQWYTKEESWGARNRHRNRLRGPIRQRLYLDTGRIRRVRD